MRLLLLFFLIVVSCKKTVQEIDENAQDKSLRSMAKEHNTIKKVMPNFEKEIDDWKELSNVNLFLNRFKKASANEILSNAIELKALTTGLRDSVKPAIFELPSVNARISILHNESLRLADMNTIPAISSEEVHAQTNKIIEAFSSINDKINTVLLKIQFDESIDVDVSFIGLDTTKIDSISRKMINLKKKEQQERKPSVKELMRKQQ